MYVRLAFAVAAFALEPEILIVDEVLAVGDAEFQKKCLGRISDVSKKDGRTVLFVSHNPGVVSSLCSSVIWLDKGMVRSRGNPQTVIGQYFSRASDRERLGAAHPICRGHGSHACSERLRLVSLEWLSDLPLRYGEPARARIHFRTSGPVPETAFSMGFSTIDGTRLCTFETDFQEGERPDLTAGEYSVDINIKAMPLAPDV